MHTLDQLKLAVIGLGYVGLPLAVEFGKKRTVVGFDLDASLYTLLQILSVTLFEKMPLQQAFPGSGYKTPEGVPCNQLNLFAF